MSFSAAGALDGEELLAVELEMRHVPQIAESSHGVLESAIFATFASISFGKSWKSFL